MTDVPVTDIDYPPPVLAGPPLPRREHLWIYDLAGEQVGVLVSNVDELVHDVRLDQSETLSFRVRADDPKAELLIEDAEIAWRGRRFWIVETNKTRSSAGAFVDVEAEATWTRLGDDNHEGSLELFGYTAADGLAAIMAGASRGWTAISAEILDPITTWYLEEQDATILDLLRQWAKITGYELTFDTVAKTVSLVSEVGADRGTSFRYGRNVTSVSRRARPPECTRLYMFGRNGLDMAGVNPSGETYVEDFTYYTDQGLTLTEARDRYTRARSITDSSFTSDADLYAEAARRIAILAQPRVSYEMTAVDLAELTGLPEGRFTVGDTVRVADHLLGDNVRTRIVRTARYPLDPARSTIELAFLNGATADPRTSSSRPSASEEWVLFEARRDTPRNVRNSSTILGRLDLTTIPTAEWVAGYSLAAVGVGTGTVTITVVDDVTGTPLFPSWTISVTPGAQIRESFTFGEKELEARERAVVVRAVSSGGGIGIDVEGSGNALWVLAKGTTQRTIRYDNSALYSYTGAVQSFTVPDDVTELRITAYGAPGGAPISDLYTENAGGMVRARFAVLGGALLDVNVGGTPTNSAAGWPNGGAGDVALSSSWGGGGSSDVRPTGAAFADALLVAAAGGGFGSGSTTLNTYAGGRGAFLTGGNGRGASNPDGHQATGATQYAGGIGGYDSDYGAGPWAKTGQDGSAGQGGNAGNTTNAFAEPGGGGGGGWYGGGGAGTGGAAGLRGGGGGGGAGWIGSTGFDWEYTDAIRTTAHGEVLIEWQTPA